jgi:serine/threonine protein kinase
MTTPAGQSRSLGRYQLLFLLGQGGMGEVHLARLSGAAGFEKLCIVKTVLPNLMGDQQFIERFHHEARVLVQLTHSNIAQVYDMGEADGTLYMAIEYVPGVDLSRVETRVQRQGAHMPVQMAVYIGQRIAEALGYAHRKTGADGLPLGIVHRDVSPQNVMVSYEGEVKVIDFGLAKSSARSKHTLPSTVMGKLGYMSPEQALARPVDHRSDIFSAGIVVWEMLAGRPMYAGGTMSEMVAQMAMGEVPSLRDVRPEISETLEQVVMRALARDPAARYQRADDFARALNELAVREHLSVGAEDVGNYVRAMCPEEFAAERQLQSKLSVMRKKGEVPEVVPREPELDGTFVRASDVARAETASGQFMTPAMRAMSMVQPSDPDVGGRRPSLRPTPAPEPRASTADDMAAVKRSRTPLLIAGLLLVIGVSAAGLFFVGTGDGQPQPQPKPVQEEPVVAQPVDAGVLVATKEPEPEPSKPEPSVPEQKQPTPMERIAVTGPVWKVIRKGDEAFIMLDPKDKVREGERLDLIGEPEADGKTRPVYAHGAVREVKGSLASVLIDDDVPLPDKLFASRDLTARAVATAPRPVRQPDGTAPRPEPARPANPEPARPVEPGPSPQPEPARQVEPARQPEPQPEPARPQTPVTQIYGDVLMAVGKVMGNRSVVVTNKNKFMLTRCTLRLPSNMIYSFGSQQIMGGSSVRVPFDRFISDKAPVADEIKKYLREDWALMRCAEGSGYFKTTYDRR